MGTIVIVDDAPFVRLLLRETLEELEDEGHELHSAEDGLAGWALIQKTRPDIVFLDVMMPRMSGYEVCQHVKSDPELCDTFVVLLTAKGQEVDRERGIEVGADEYVTKPFDPDHIVSTARSALCS